MNGAQNYLLLFADLVGSTEVAVEASPTSYSRMYVASYHWAARRAHDFILDKAAFPQLQLEETIATPRLAGDEVLSFTRIPDDPVRQEYLAASAVAFAYVVKLFWLVSPYNLQRIRGNQFPRDVAVGIHVGPAVTVPCDDAEDQIASLHINIAKRIEGIARDGKQSRIFASYEVKDLYHKWIKRHQGIDRKHKAPLSFTRFRKRDNPYLVRGIPKPLQLFELEWDYDDRGHLRYILDQLHRTPKTEDLDVEKATRLTMELLLPPGGRPVFTSEGGELRVETGYTSAADYIRSWFHGIESASKLFFDEYWLVITSYLASCGMVRHRDVGEDARAAYVEIADRVCDRLEELAAN